MAIIETEKAPGKQRNRPLKDITGRRYGRLTVVAFVERDPNPPNTIWLFECDCGTRKKMRIGNVRTGNVTSCGCVFTEMLVKRNTTHGLCKAEKRTYRSWKDMRARCRNPKHKDFYAYGGRGISVCDRWDSFADFFADMGQRPEGETIDRIDTNGNYHPLNCRWATDSQQANNKRNNHVLEWQGRSQTVQQWCDEYGMDHSKVRYRIAQGWPYEDVFSDRDFRK